MTEIGELSALVSELEKSDTTVESAIEATERRLKMLRTIKQTLSAGSAKEPKPRSAQKKKEAAVA